MPLLRLRAMEVGLSFIDASAASLHMAHCATTSGAAARKITSTTSKKSTLRGMGAKFRFSAQGFQHFAVGINESIHLSQLFGRGLSHDLETPLRLCII